MRLLVSLLACLCASATASASATPQDPAPIRIGAKNFAESGILAELMAQAIEARTDLRVERQLNLGGTKICWSALGSDQLDIYADYTGTLWANVLNHEQVIRDPLQIYVTVQEECRRRFDIEVLPPFGFDNTYRLIVREEMADRLGLQTVSDLLAHDQELSAGFSIEFTDRPDGWRGLRPAYGLDFASVRGMEHGLAYEALRAGQLDVMDAYATDGKLLRFAVRMLEDDRRFFLPYQAVPLVRREVLERHPELREVLADFAYSIPDRRMQELNLMVESGNADFAGAARSFLTDTAGPSRSGGDSQRGVVFQLFRTKTLVLIGQHIGLTLAAVLLAVLLAVPLGVACTRRPTLARVSLHSAGILQTIPSLALLALAVTIPGLGLSARSAILALTLYAVLPVLRNTFTGIREVDNRLVEAARGLGLTDGQILREVEMPLAAPTIMAGIRTATVISIGVATLAAFIGAGGLGQPITEGLYLNDSALILAGAIPAAALAILADQLLGLLERRIAPKVGSSS